MLQWVRQPLPGIDSRRPQDISGYLALCADVSKKRKGQHKRRGKNPWKQQQQREEIENKTEGGEM